MEQNFTPNELLESNKPQSVIESKKKLDTEVLRIGNLNIHLLPFDHVNGTKELPEALKKYQKIKTLHPNIIPILEYFPPEIEQANQHFVPQIEFHNIKDSYGAFTQLANIEKILIVDPAYNEWSSIPELLPILQALGIPLAALKLAAYKSNGEQNETENKKVRKKHMTRRRFLQWAKNISLATVGTSSMSTAINEFLKLPLGSDPNYTPPPELPLNSINGREFRMLTIAHALKQMGNENKSDIQEMVLIYPPKHIERIKKILTTGGVYNDAKFNIYKAMYTTFGTMNIREWEKDSSNNWHKTKQTPITFISPFPTTDKTQLLLNQ